MIKFYRMPFERKSYIVTNTIPTTVEPWEEFEAWFTENNIEYSCQGDIMHFKDDLGESQFILRWGKNIG